MRSSGEVIVNLLEKLHININATDLICDEAFCQIIKQICGNMNPESVLRSWELLLIVSSFSPCTVQLAPALLAWMYEASEKKKEKNRRLSVSLPGMKKEEQVVLCAMMERDESEKQRDREA